MDRGGRADTVNENKIQLFVQRECENKCQRCEGGMLWQIQQRKKTLQRSLQDPLKDISKIFERSSPNPQGS